MAYQSEQPGPIEAKKEQALRDMFADLSKPMQTLREALGDNYQKRVFDTDQPYVKKVKKYDDDPRPEEVWLDDHGRLLRITDYGREETFTHDDDGYLVEATLIQNGGQGWDRKFIYITENGKKRLARLEVTRYAGIGSTTEGMKRGEQIGGVQVVNFDPTGKPDNLIPLWVY